MRPYDKVSLIYNGLMKDVDFKFWTDYILDIASNYTTADSSFLELAAGTCGMANIIKNRYPNIIATDVSLPMMQIDDQNCIQKVCCSMIQLPFKNKFDFVYCTFDSVNYLLTQKELFYMFREIKSLLNEKGIFTFDASLENNSLGFKEMQVTDDKYNGYTFKRINSYSNKNKIHKNVFYIQNSSGIKFKEIHKQRIYSFETYFRLVDKAGLMVKECYDGFTFNDGSTESERVQFVIGKSTA